jgi:hypothetical protein
MKWWFDEFLPSRLLEDFPEYDYADNPVAGVGCQAIYDNENAVLYFCKKDYKLRPGFNDNPLTPNRIIYVSDRKKTYFVDTLTTQEYDLGDPFLFEDASWTASYDPKNRYWISFHDWHPSLTLPTKSTIVTTRDDEFWSHNFACNDYCNFYGTQYPFEIEFPIVTGQTITTLKNVEYILECYRRENDYCVDQFHVLDYNFDYAVIHNTEQTSAYLKLNIYAKNNPPLNLQYPKQTPSILVDPDLPPYPGFDILFSKEENKYRFNQFWDSVFDRGEFPRNPPEPIGQYPPTNPVIPGTTILSGTYREENLWVTQSNGYIKTINYNNINLNKSPLEHKKFRHYVNFIKLSKVNSRDTNMILKIGRSKIHGKGLFSGEPIKKGELIGQVHSGIPINKDVIRYIPTQYGKFYNHNEKDYNTENEVIGENRYLRAIKNIPANTELTANYRKNPDMEQPEDFGNGKYASFDFDKTLSTDEGLAKAKELF